MLIDPTDSDFDSHTHSRTHTHTSKKLTLSVRLLGLVSSVAQTDTQKRCIVVIVIQQQPHLCILKSDNILSQLLRHENHVSAPTYRNMRT